MWEWAFKQKLCGAFAYFGKWIIAFCVRKNSPLIPYVQNNKCKECVNEIGCGKKCLGPQLSSCPLFIKYFHHLEIAFALGVVVIIWLEIAIAATKEGTVVSIWDKIHPVFESEMHKT